MFTNPHTSHSKGRLGEEKACQYLLKNNFNIISRNYRAKFAEIDIIAQKQNDLYFIEVKARKDFCNLNPYMAVDYNKQRKIAKLAEQFLANSIADPDNIYMSVLTITYKDKIDDDINIDFIKEAYCCE